MKVLIEKAPLEDIGEAAYRLALSYKGFSISKEAYMEKFSELLHAALREALAEQAEQESVLSYHVYDVHTKLGHAFFYEDYKWHKDKPCGVLNKNIKLDLYAAPVRTKDLTDDEIDQVRDKTWCFSNSLREFARAVIAADREKNK